MHTDDQMLCVIAPFYYFKKNMSTRKPIPVYLVKGMPGSSCATDYLLCNQGFENGNQ